MSEGTRLQPLTVDFSSLDSKQKLYLAKLLNDKISQIIWVFCEINKIPVLIKLLTVDSSFSFDELNDWYVNIVDVLERLYKTDVSFKNLAAAPPWKKIKILHGHEEEILNDKTFMTKHEKHCSEIERQWIFIGKPKTALTYQIHVWVESIEQKLSSYRNEIEVLQNKQKQFSLDPDEVLFTIKYDSIRGMLSVNGVLIQKVRIDSVLDKFMSKAQKNPTKRTRIEGSRPNLPKTIGNIKIPKLLKDLFFEGRSKKSCILNLTITRGRLLESGASSGEIQDLLQRYPSQFC